MAIPEMRLIDNRHDSPDAPSNKVNSGNRNTRYSMSEWPVYNLNDPFWILFFNNCNRSLGDITRLKSDSDCVIWHGTRARYDMSKPMFRFEPAPTSRKNACPQFHFKGISYSARNVIYAAFVREVHGETLDKGGLDKRVYLRLASRCSNVSCVNPAHHYRRVKSGGIQKKRHYKE